MIIKHEYTCQPIGRKQERRDMDIQPIGSHTFLHEPQHAYSSHNIRKQQVEEPHVRPAARPLEQLIQESVHGHGRRLDGVEKSRSGGHAR